MAVQAVHLEADAFLVCLNHALSTEKEEVMGLCIGEVDTSRIVHIHSVIILRRSDKRKDRVEISPEQLSAASTEAERLAEMTGRPMRVVGWYHSHPHITVWPSHVDVRTQAMYQMMDQGFVGLIFSCFIEDKNTKTGRILYTCFQSIQAQKSSEYERIEIPIHVVPHETIGKVCLESAVELPKILCQEEQDAYRRIHSLTHLDSVTKIHNGSGPWNRRVRGEKCVSAVISDAANFCLLLVASVDHDLISSNVLDCWPSTQAGKRWEGSLGRKRPGRTLTQDLFSICQTK
ncbi:lys-63-specific deubiquitinase BRCC36 isoform X1 [Pipra filicauda]|uniref:Lys-63-specific deubiquitinase BRCC36 isoform X1 n=1 Tax=Pipra filicauda TaxID=649802 RepID=A0A7R5K3U7_9PASS|nr:lys-63-specific deubiquitinase BRCC36 isoform X1 [Pipra filicauda]